MMVGLNSRGSELPGHQRYLGCLKQSPALREVGPFYLQGLLTLALIQFSFVQRLLSTHLCAWLGLGAGGE